MRQGLLIALLLSMFLVATKPVLASELRLSEVALAPCDIKDPGAQPVQALGTTRNNITSPEGASCYVLSGTVENPSKRAVVDTDVYARILDRSGEPVLQNRTRVGSIGDVDPGSHPFALRLAVPNGTPGPFEVKNPRARGFKAPVRSRASGNEELLPLEQKVVTTTKD